MTADPSGYDDDQNIYDLSTDLGFELVCPLSVDTKIHLTQKKGRINLLDFYESALGQTTLYSKRSTHPS
jgi:hypothetical protein